MCFPHGCILTLHIWDTGGPLGVGVDLSVFPGVVVAGPPVVVKRISNNMIYVYIYIYIIYATILHGVIEYIRLYVYQYCISILYVCITCYYIRIYYTIDYILIMHSKTKLRNSTGHAPTTFLHTDMPSSLHCPSVVQTSAGLMLGPLTAHTFTL